MTHSGLCSTDKRECQSWHWLYNSLSRLSLMPLWEIHPSYQVILLSLFLASTDCSKSCHILECILFGRYISLLLFIRIYFYVFVSKLWHMYAPSKLFQSQIEISFPFQSLPLCFPILCFPHDGTILSLSRTTLCCGDCPVPRRTFSSIPELYTPDAKNKLLPQLWQSKMTPDIAKAIRDLKSPPIENHR